MNILTTYFTVSHLFTFVREGTMHAEFNNIILFTVLYSWFQHCIKDMSKVTAQHIILEYVTKGLKGTFSSLCLQLLQELK